ncbi:extracellular solute-binding protein [Escherichia coli]|nr:extracellular solute-binding protein [Escherichia coli]
MQKQSLTGAGATFPAPVYAKWADTYQKETGNKVNYEGIGSSGGVKQIIANTVDFCLVPLTRRCLTKNWLKEGLFQFPTVIGGVVLAVNIRGLKSGELVLDGKTLGDIYLGKIKKWDDKPIAKLDPGLKLPSQKHCCSTPRRWLRDFLRLHQLPGESERRVENEQRWYWLYRKMADRSGR